MPQVYVDPDRLRRFSGQLKGFADVVDNVVQSLRGEMGRLGDTWRDQEFQAFSREFASVQQQLNKFVAEAKKTAPLLEKDASAIEEYQRYRQ